MDQQPPSQPVSPMGTVCPQCNATAQPGQTVCTICHSHLYAVPSAGKKGAGIIVAIVCGVVFGGIVLVGLLASMLLPTLAKAKTKANRMKCANNLGQIHRAFSSYSTEAEGATAHLDSQYAPIWGTQGHNLRARAMGYSSWTQMQRGYRWMNGYPIRQSLQNYSSLASPLDQKTVAMQRRHNIKSFDQWGRDWYSSEDYRGYIPHHMQSYAIAMQGDLDVQDTVLALTRNVVGSSHAAYYRQYGGYARDRDRWLFPHYPFPYTWHNYRTHLNGTVNNHTVAFFGPGSIKYSMTGMAKDQANWVTGGGAVLQGSSSEFNDQLKMADRTFNEGSAATRAPCLTILRPYQNR